LVCFGSKKDQFFYNIRYLEFSLFFYKVRIVQRNNFFLWLLWIVLITLTAYFVFYFDSLKHLRSKFTVSEASDFVLEFSDHALEHLLQTLLV